MKISKEEILCKLTQILLSLGFGDNFQLSFSDTIQGWFNSVAKINQEIAKMFQSAIDNGLGQEVL